MCPERARIVSREGSLLLLTEVIILGSRLVFEQVSVEVLLVTIVLLLLMSLVVAVILLLLLTLLVVATAHRVGALRHADVLDRL